MKFFEYMAKRIFNEEGIPILEGHVANSAEEATSIASDMGVPAVSYTHLTLPTNSLV